MLPNSSSNVGLTPLTSLLPGIQVVEAENLTLLGSPLHLSAITSVVSVKLRKL